MRAAAARSYDGAHTMSDVADDVLASLGQDARRVLRAVATMSPLPMLIVDPHRPDRPITFCNRAFTALTQYEEHEVLGRNARLLQGELTDDAALDTLRVAIAAERECQVELWNYRKDGTRFWCSMFVGPVFDADGKLLCWFGSQLDSTARREMEEARARAQRMDTLGLMAAGIAHEFNNLMTVVLANAEGARAGNLTPRQDERLDRVNWAARAAGRLTQQMLSFAGRQSLEAKTIDLNKVLTDFDRLLGQVATAGRQVRVELAGEPLPARVDLGQLELALINLVRNASDASAHNAAIMVSTCITQLDGADAVAIAVADKGSGMPPDVAARATEPFFTTKDPGKGTGLGLSMVSGFVQQSGGRVVVETGLGKGTTVTLVFPRAGH